MSINYITSLKKISLREAVMYFGYSSDHIAYLIRKGKVAGEKVYTKEYWKVSRKGLLDYLNGKERTSSLKNLFKFLASKKHFFKKYLSLKEASEISGYASDYIGYLVRQGKIPGRKFYRGASWVTTRNSVKEYLDSKPGRKDRNFFNFSLPFRGENYFSLKISKISFVIALVAIFFGGLVVLANFSQDQNQIARIFPSQIQAGKSIDGRGWQNEEKIKGSPEVGPEGDINYFSEQNSAIYKGGADSLLLSNFNNTQLDLDSKYFNEQIQKDIPIENNGNNDSAGNEPGQNTDSGTSSSQNIGSQDQQESSTTQNDQNPAVSDGDQTGSGGNEDVPVQGTDGGESDGQNTDGLNGVSNEPAVQGGDSQGQPQSQPEVQIDASAGQTSLIDKLKGVFGRSTVRAEELLSFKDISQNQLVSAKIKISLAGGSKDPDIVPAGQNPSSTSEQGGLWGKVKNIFSSVFKHFPQVAKAQTSPEAVETPTQSEQADAGIEQTNGIGSSGQEAGQAVEENQVQVQNEPVVGNNDQAGTETDPATSTETSTDVIDNIGSQDQAVDGSENGSQTTTSEEVLPNPDDKIIIWYSFNDGSSNVEWKKLGTISQEFFSNALNGGYLSFDAPFLNSWDDIGSLQIKIEGAIGGQMDSYIYIDSFWVEAEYQASDEKMKDFELKPVKDGWRADEEPAFELVKKMPEVSPVQKFFTSIGSALGITKQKEADPEIQANLSTPGLETERKKIEELNGGDIVRNVVQEKGQEKREIKIAKSSFNGPGRYNLSINVDDSGKTYEFTQDFTWGVLAINLNKSIYLPGDKAFLQMGVLDEAGKTLCDADLTMEIIAPDGGKTVLSSQNILPEQNYSDSTATSEVFSSSSATTSGSDSVTSSYEEIGNDGQGSGEEQTSSVETTTTETESQTVDSDQSVSSTDQTGTVEVIEEATSSVTTSSDEGGQAGQTTNQQQEQPQEEQAGEGSDSQNIQPVGSEGENAALLNGLSNIFKISSAKAEEASSSAEQEAISRGVIEKSPECGPSSVTNTPDYFAYYDINSTGTYQIKLTAVTKNGTHEITDSFESRDWVPFDVERMAPTRIYPPAAYQTTIKIKANQDFSGQIKENIPLGFEIDKIEYRVNNELSVFSPFISNSADAQAIEWQADFKKDDLVELNYQFRAPNISPYSYLLGHLEFYDISSADPSQIYFSELRSWQIAADAVISFVGVANYDTASTTTAPCAKPTNTTTSDIMFALVMRGSTTTNPNSVPTGWTLIGSETTTHLWKLYYKMASSTEASTYTWGWAGAGKTAITIVTYRGGFDTTNPISATSTTVYKTSNTNVIATTTAALLNSPLLFFASVYATAARTFTKPSVPTSDWVENSDYGSTTSCLWRETASMTWASSGATGTTSATVSGAAIILKQAFAVALKPSNVDVSGTIFTDEGSTTSTAGSVINLAVNGVWTASTTASTTNGSYTLSTGTTTIAAGTVFTVYTSNASEKANTITRSGTASITGLNLYKDHIIVRHEDAGPITIADLDKYDSNNSAYMLYAASSTPATLTATSGAEFFVWTGKTFSTAGAAGAISLGDVDINGTFTATSTQTISVSGSWDATGGTFTPVSSNVTFTATTTGKTIAVNSSSFYDLTFNGSGGGWTFSAAATTSNDLTVTAGTVSSAYNMRVSGGDVTGNGTLNWTGGTFTVAGTGNFAGSTAWNFYNLTFGSGSAGTTTDIGSATDTVSNVFTVAASQVLNSGGNIWNLSGSGTPFVNNGTFNAQTSTVSYTGVTTTSVTAATYYNLRFDPASVFFDDFETNNFSKWNEASTTGANSSVQTTSTQKYQGSYSAAFKVGANNGSAYMEKDSLGQFKTYTSDFYLYIPAWTWSGGATVSNIFECFDYNTFAERLTLAVKNTGDGKISLAPSYWTDAQAEIQKDSGFDFSTSTWYHVKAKQNISTTAGYVYVWVNDSLVYSTTSVNTGSTDVDNIMAGSSYADGAVQYAYEDNINFYGIPTYTLATTTGKTFTVNNDLTVGNNGGVKVTAATYNPIIDVNGSVAISAVSEFVAPASSAFTVAGNWANSGTFTSSNGTVTFDGSGTSTFSGVTSFYNLTSITASKILQFTTSTAASTTVAGALTLSGQTCATQIKLRSTSSGTPWYLNALGTATVGYADIKDSNATGSAATITASDSTDSGSNTKWSISGTCADSLTVSGTVYTDTWNTTSTAGSVINLAVNGVFVGSATASTTNGSYTISAGASTIATSTVITVYTSNASEYGNTVTRYAGSGDITNLNIYKNHIIVRHEDAGPITIADLDKYDSNDSAYMLYAASSTPATLTVNSGKDFYVNPGSVFSTGGAGGNVSFATLDIAGTFTATSTQTISVSGNWYNWKNFNPASSTVQFTATSTGHEINVDGDPFYNLTFNGSGGGWTFLDAATTTNDLTVTAGTVISDYNMTVLGGDVSGNGILSWGSNFLVDGTGNFGGSSSWSFHDLTFGDGSGAATTTNIGSGTVMIYGNLTIASSQVLNAGGSIWKLADSSTPFVINGTFNAQTSTIAYIGVQDTNITEASYYNLQLDPYYVFFDGFETNDFSKWDGISTTTGSILVTTSTQAYAGTYSLGFKVGGADGRANTEEDYLGQAKTSITDFYIYIPSDFSWGTASGLTILGFTDNLWNDRLALSAEDWGSIRLTYMYRNSAGAGQWVDGGIYLTKGQWQHIKVEDFVDASNGYIKIWVDGNLVANNSGIDTGSTNIDDIYGGSTWANGAHSMIYQDNISFYNVPTYTLGTAASQTITVANDFTAGDGVGGVKVTGAVQNPILDVNGNVTIATNSVLTAPASSSFTVAGSWANAGTFTNSTGTVTFDAGSTGKTIAAGSSPFYNITFNNASGGWTVTDNATSTNNWAITNAAAFEVSVSKTVEVKGQYSIGDTIPSVTTWNANSNLYLNSGTAYTIGSKTQNQESYAILQIGANTDVRTWNSSASTSTVDSSGSLYSMDHGNVNGSAYIWGDFHTNANDYWSYAKDFDGTAGANRQCLLTLASGAAVAIDSGDSLEIKGGGSSSGDISTISYAPASGSWNLNNNSGSELLIQEATVNYMKVNAGTVTVLNTVLNNEVTPNTGAILNVDWYLGTHLVDKDSTGHNIDTNGNAITISEANSNAVIYQNNGTSWSGPVSSTTTDSGSDGKNPQPNTSLALRIREYQQTASATTTYKYNLAVAAGVGFSAYDYYNNYGSNYITSVSSTATTSVDKCISTSWQRNAVNTMNTPYSTVNDPPTNGSWYIGMSSDLQFSVDSASVNLGTLSAGNSWTATGTTILYATTSYAGGYSVTAYASNNGQLRLGATSNYVARWNYANSTPALWGTNCQDDAGYCGFGYTTNDTTLAGTGGLNRFATSTKYSGFATSSPGDMVADSAASVSGASTTITYKVSAKSSYVGGSYDTTVYYLCTVNY